MNKLLKIKHIENRIFGLDLLRFIAIFMVLLGHSLMFIPQEYKKDVFKFMLDGVSIFFVLSGFLIGRILFQIILTKTLDFKEIVSFWKKRWLRTIPAYTFILLVLGSATLLFVPENFPATWYEFLYFSQNLFRERPSFFAESWSLCIEEWFYLLTPIYFFFLVVKVNKKLAWIVTTILFFIVVITLIRYNMYSEKFAHYTTTPDFDTRSKFKSAIEFLIFPRLDAIMFGVLGAIISLLSPNFWKSNLKYVMLLIAVILFFSFKSTLILGSTPFEMTIRGSLYSFSVLLCLPYLSNLQIAPNRLTNIITFTSVVSYSLYLVNLNVVANFIIKLGVLGGEKFDASTNPNWPVYFGLFWVLTFVIGFLNYRFIEVPFLKLRK